MCGHLHEQGGKYENGGTDVQDPLNEVGGVKEVFDSLEENEAYTIYELIFQTPIEI
jgi:hypothetical protein